MGWKLGLVILARRGIVDKGDEGQGDLNGRSNEIDPRIEMVMEEAKLGGLMETRFSG